MASQRTIQSLFLAGTVVLATLAGVAATAKPADAGVYVRITPRVRVVKPKPARTVVVTPKVVVAPKPIVLTHYDRRVASRLAAATRYTKARLLAERAKGYNWSRVGKRLHIRPVVVRACL